eukprot:CAMPEP_0194393918 /NCGR_PEP_ID=MMETSP0174-20130528/123558_1 /TAXON_ID=216777 /ORGANISM="Proboscia alata, Strain PI-D3" /LENGTH=695 /DNA_ID=CAMNT_0039189647 /DNA_START=34 /DNA_END=2121 /DNA_ORIENTATION=-
MQEDDKDAYQNQATPVAGITSAADDLLRQVQIDAALQSQEMYTTSHAGKQPLGRTNSLGSHASQPSSCTGGGGSVMSHRSNVSSGGSMASRESISSPIATRSYNSQSNTESDNYLAYCQLQPPPPPPTLQQLEPTPAAVPLPPDFDSLSQQQSHSQSGQYQPQITSFDDMYVMSRVPLPSSPMSQVTHNTHGTAISYAVGPQHPHSIELIISQSESYDERGTAASPTSNMGGFSLQSQYPTGSMAPSSDTSVILGMDELERQTEEWENRRMLQAEEERVATEQVTDSSSAQPATTPPTSSDPQTGGTIKQLLKWPSTRRTGATEDIEEGGGRSQRITGNESPPDNDLNDDYMWETTKPLNIVSGYLEKQTKKGLWQRRYFETDGENLTYYKNSKRTKYLANLDLAKVGAISLCEKDPTKCMFTIQVAGRPYLLRAEDPSICQDWVINLNRVREARIQVGRIKLVDPYQEKNRSRSNSSGGDLIPRITYFANRDRSHATVGDENIMKMMAEENKRKGDLIHLPGSSDHSRQVHETRNEVGQEEDQESFVTPTADWQKRRSKFQKIRRKLLKWAKKIKMLSFIGNEKDTAVGDNDQYPTVGGDPGFDQMRFPTASEDCATTAANSEHLSSTAPPGAIGDLSIAQTASQDSSKNHSKWILDEQKRCFSSPGTVTSESKQMKSVAQDKFDHTSNASGFL